MTISDEVDEFSSRAKNIRENTQSLGDKIEEARSQKTGNLTDVIRNLIDDEEEFIYKLSDFEREFVSFLIFDVEETIADSKKIIEWEKDIIETLNTIEEEISEGESELRDFKDDLANLESERTKLSDQLSENRKDAVLLVLNLDELLDIFRCLRDSISSSAVGEKKIEHLASKIENEDLMKKLKYKEAQTEKIRENLEQIDFIIEQLRELKDERDHIKSPKNNLEELEKRIRIIQGSKTGEEYTKKDLDAALTLENILTTIKMKHRNQSDLKTQKDVIKAIKTFLDNTPFIKTSETHHWRSKEDKWYTIGERTIEEDNTQLKYSAKTIESEKTLLKLEVEATNKEDYTTETNLTLNIPRGWSVFDNENISGSSGTFTLNKTLDPKETVKCEIKVQRTGRISDIFTIQSKFWRKYDEHDYKKSVIDLKYVKGLEKVELLEEILKDQKVTETTRLGYKVKKIHDKDTLKVDFYTKNLSNDKITTILMLPLPNGWEPYIVENSSSTDTGIIKSKKTTLEPGEEVFCSAIIRANQLHNGEKFKLLEECSFNQKNTSTTQKELYFEIN